MSIKNSNFQRVVMALALLLFILTPLLAASQALATAPDSEEYQEAALSLAAQAELERGDPGFWSYALSTLLIRFVGIFVVLGILQIVMQISGRIFMAAARRKKEAKSS